MKHFSETGLGNVNGLKKLIGLILIKSMYQRPSGQNPGSEIHIVKVAEMSRNH